MQALSQLSYTPGILTKKRLLANAFATVSAAMGQRLSVEWEYVKFSCANAFRPQPNLRVQSGFLVT